MTYLEETPHNYASKQEINTVTRLKSSRRAVRNNINLAGPLLLKSQRKKIMHYLFFFLLLLFRSIFWYYKLNIDLQIVLNCYYFIKCQSLGTDEI